MLHELVSHMVALRCLCDGSRINSCQNKYLSDLRQAMTVQTPPKIPLITKFKELSSVLHYIHVCTVALVRLYNNIQLIMDMLIQD